MHWCRSRLMRERQRVRKTVTFRFPSRHLGLKSTWALLWVGGVIPTWKSSCRWTDHQLQRLPVLGHAPTIQLCFNSRCFLLLLCKICQEVFLWRNEQWPSGRCRCISQMCKLQVTLQAPYKLWGCATNFEGCTPEQLTPWTHLSLPVSC